MIIVYGTLAPPTPHIRRSLRLCAHPQPVVGNSGFIPPTQEFLEGVRELSTKYGALLVFDEVTKDDGRWSESKREGSKGSGDDGEKGK